jgi:hypothetical protein
LSLLGQGFDDYGVKVSLHYEDHGLIASEFDYNVLVAGTKTAIKVKLEEVNVIAF